MAKKRKSTRAKKHKKAEASHESSVFWPLTGAVLLCIAALFLLLGGFNTGGPLPIGMFNGAYWLLGWAAYLSPLALGYWGFYKFVSEDHKIPLNRFVCMLSFVVLAACWFCTGFVSRNSAGELTNGYGGAIGNGLGGLILQVLDVWPAAILFFVLAALAGFFTFGISPKVVLKLGQLFSQPERAGSDEDTGIAELKKNAINNFKLKEGVPVEHVSEKEPEVERPRLTTLKNTAQKLTVSENHEALTLASDPDWQVPTIDLLNQKQDKANAGDVNARAEIIKETFANFNIDVEMEGANIGPRVTQYTLKPPSGVKLSKISAMADNLALDLAATSIRIEAPIPGKRLAGVEVPNQRAATVRISSLLQTNEWKSLASPIGFVIGKDITGAPVVADLARMPHLLVAGQTGSGKSVMINTILTSLLYRNSPSDLKLILVDPKQVEMAPYNDIPHLLTPVINEPEKCISALKWAVAEMERRLRTMAEAGKRSIAEYNNLKKEEGMPYIVIVIDELSDLMMMAARDVEALIVRLTQKARAAGIHLVLATQRPSVNVITGLIKANVPGRIAFTVASGVDSKTIIDGVGAEKLLGMGDMLLKTDQLPKPKRIQGAFISDEETQKVVDFLKMQREPQYDDEVVSQPVQLNGKGSVVAEIGDGSDEPIYQDAVRVVIEAGKASTSLLQRRLRIGYGKAARLIETMEEQGIIGNADGNRPRDVLVSSVDQVFSGGNIASGEGDVYDDMPDDDPSPSGSVA